MAESDTRSDLQFVEAPDDDPLSDEQLPTELSEFDADELDEVAERLWEASAEYGEDPMLDKLYNIIRAEAARRRDEV